MLNTVLSKVFSKFEINEFTCTQTIDGICRIHWNKSTQNWLPIENIPVKTAIDMMNQILSVTPMHYVVTDTLRSAYEATGRNASATAKVFQVSRNYMAKNIHVARPQLIILNNQDIYKYVKPMPKVTVPQHRGTRGGLAYQGNCELFLLNNRFHIELAYLQEKTYAGAARELTRKKIPTMLNAKQWYAVTVRRAILFYADFDNRKETHEPISILLQPRSIT